MRRRSRRWSWIAGTVSFVLVAAACGQPAVSGGPSPSASPSAALASASASTSTSPSIAPSATPSTAPSAGPTPTVEPSSEPSGTPDPAASETIVRAYFLLADAADGPPTLVPVLREVPATRAVARAAMTALLAGPSRTERRADPGISTLIPDDVDLLGIAIEEGIATVDLSSGFVADADEREIAGRLAEVVYTLTQFSRVERVRVEIDGASPPAVAGTWTRRDFRSEWLPPIWVDDPAWGAAIGRPGEVRGLADVFEAQFRIALLARDGDTLVERGVTASCGSGCWGRFGLELDYDVGRGQWGTLRVWDPSERDGSPEAVRDYPVWLSPD
jgi:hypothetical protein